MDLSPSFHFRTFLNPSYDNNTLDFPAYTHYLIYAIREINMASKTISIKFDGYWPDENKSGIPPHSGVYYVYACIYNEEKKTVSLHTLVYIGEAGNCKSRIAGHEKHKLWLKHLKSGQVLCYSFGPVPSVDRDRAEAALIFKYKPPENTEYTNSFPFDDTTMSLSGETDKLVTKFTVKRTEEE